MEGIIITIRSVLTSTKGHSDLPTLQKDYLTLMGTPIPYKQFGYLKLEDFLRDIPSISITNGPNGILIDAIPTEKSAHISSLVSRQKSSSKKKKISVRRGPPQRKLRHSKQANWCPASTGKKWQPQFQASPRPAAVSHNQIVNWHPQQAGTSKDHSQQTNAKKGEKKKKKASKFDKPVSKVASPRTRAGLNARSYSDDGSSTTTPSPTPPEIEKVDTSRVKRCNSTGVTAISRIVENIDLNPRGIHFNTARPRMRTANYNTPKFAMANGNGQIQFKSPEINSREMEELRQNAMAQFDSSNPIWSFSSSEDGSRKDSISDKPTWTYLSTINKYFPDSGNPKTSTQVELESFVKQHKLGEIIIKVTKRKVKQGPSFFILHDCKIKIGQSTYSSYPEDFTSPEAAQLAATTQALQDLKHKYGENKHLLLSTERDILQRIPPIIEQHFHGVWANQIELDYEDIFNEQLPQNWLTLLDTLPTISVEHSIENKYVLHYCKEGQKNKGLFNTSLASDVSVPSNTVKVKEDGCAVQITCAISTVEIWCRELFTEESELYDIMSMEMDEYYAKSKERAAHINIGGFYVVYYDEVWCRIRAVQIHDANVMCFFIDYGDEYLVPKTEIFPLPRQFARQQAQAFVCRLAGLEELVNISAANKHLGQLTGKEFLLKPVNFHSNNENKELDPILSVVLFDTSGAEDLININKKMIREIAIDSAVSTLDKETVNKVFVSHATEDGDVYVQLHSEGYDKFMDLMEEITGVNFETDIPNAALDPKALTISEKLFITKWEDDKYYRCKITDISPDKQFVQVYFIDYGNGQIIRLSEGAFYPLEKISDVLCWFPPQAVMVKIDIEKNNLPKDFANQILDILPNDQLALLKIIRTENNIHYCDFFKRSAENVLFSVNSAILLEQELSNGVEDGNNNDRSENLTKKLQRLNKLEGQCKKPVPSTGSLDAPELPSLNGWFDVKIPCAVNPWNFFVQPYQMGEKLTELMRDLQEAYKDVEYSPIAIDDVVAGRIYASKHEDGFYYRTSVIKFIHQGSISVFYCDFGYYANLKIYQLIPLDPKFMKLPYQAIKAKLSGIKPKNAKWSMDDCKYFEELVCRKTFVSLLKDRQTDELYKYDMVLSLSLIDTHSNNDVDIEKLLIEKGIAVPVDSKK